MVTNVSQHICIFRDIAFFNHLTTMISKTFQPHAYFGEYSQLKRCRLPLVWQILASKHDQHNQLNLLLTWVVWDQQYVFIWNYSSSMNVTHKMSLVPNIDMAIVTILINLRFGTSWFYHNRSGHYRRAHLYSEWLCNFVPVVTFSKMARGGKIIIEFASWLWKWVEGFCGNFRISWNNMLLEVLKPFDCLVTTAWFVTEIAIWINM